MSEGFTSRAFRLTIEFTSATASFSSYICLPVDFWEGTLDLEQVGLSAVPVDRVFCWSLAPTLMEEGGEEAASRLMIEALGMSSNDVDGESEYIPFVIGTSVVASGIVKLSLVDGSGTTGGKNTVKIKEEDYGDDEGEELKVIYDFRPEGNAVLIPAIPSSMTPTDFLAFIKEAGGIQDVRLVRGASPGMYMALLRFQARRHASKFAETFSGRPFGPQEPEVCQVLRMAEIEFVTKVQSMVPLFDLVDFKEGYGTVKRLYAGQDYEGQEVSSCPVCLERLDSSVSGILTTICSHTYHCDCMAKWYDGSCPVCRFLLSEEDERSGSKCLECGCKENLWICLICGNIGCGRYRSRHAQSHYEACGHAFSLEIETHRVWDYVGDNYVHRMVHAQIEGNLARIVEISHPASPEPQAVVPAKKSDDPDYISSLLVAQLESQRVYYEEKLSALEASWSQANKVMAKEASGRVEDLQSRLQNMTLCHDSEANSLLKRIEQLESKIDALKKEKSELQKTLFSESAMLEQIMKSQAALEATIKRKEEEIKDLQEQVADLLLHIEGQKAINQSGLAEDLRIGSIRLVEAPHAPKKKDKPKRR